MKLTNKDYGVSFARLNSMMMIVSCHIFQYFGNELAFWFNSGVQIFLFISGFLYGQRLEQCDYQFVKRSFGKILLDYYICIIFCIGLYAIFVPEILSLKEVAKLFLCYGFGNISSVSHLWFIPIILFCYLITPIIGAIIQECLKQFSVKNLVKILSGVCILYLLIKLFFSYFVAEMVICYCLGLIVGKMKLIYDNKWQGVVALFIIPITFIVNGVRIFLNYFAKVSFESGMGKELYESFEQCTRVALGISLFLLFYYIYHHWFERFKCGYKILDLSDRYSYDIYLGHQIWILGPFSLLQLEIPLVVGIGLVVIACLILGVFIHVIASAFRRKVFKIC